MKPRESSTQLVIFALEDQRYALRLDTVEWVLRAVQITPLPKAPEVVLGVVDVRGTYLRRVRAATQRMGTLIDDMLALSRVARVELRREKVTLAELAREIVSELAERESERRVEFIAEEDFIVDGDSRLLRVVLENLLSNAWKFTRERPQARIELGQEHQDGSPVFFVRDNGAGFDMAYVDKLFGAFQRLHPASEFPGTGVGLATVQRIIHRHGGRVWAEGEVDHGATFYFTIASKGDPNG